MPNFITHEDWLAVLPLLMVGGGALLVLLADLVWPKHAPRFVSLALGIAVLVAAGAFAATTYGRNYNAFNGGFVLGGFAVVFQEIIIVAAIFSLALYATFGRADRMAGIVALMLWSTTGAMLMAGAANLMTIFLGLELAERASSQESALKYLILSSTASGFLLFGMALLFGATGSVALASLALPGLVSNPLYWLGGGFFLVGIAFKLSLMPFHVWSPDVYEGAPLPVTAFMSVVTKAGTLAVFARFAYALPNGPKLLLPFFIIAGISMIGGNLAMLAQTDLKRLLAYSGIAQAGYMVAALAGASALGMRYAIYYLAAYMFMNLGAFAVIALLSSHREEGAQMAAFRGLAQRRPGLAAAMTFFLLALAGFPPTAGFLGKILILSANVNAGYAWLAALLIAGTAISLYAYFKVVRMMYDPHDQPAATVRIGAPLAYAGIALCALFVLAMTFYPLTPSNVLPLVR